MKHAWIALLLAPWLSASARAAPPQLALVGGTVHPVGAPPIEGGMVLIEGERIVYVGKTKPVPPGVVRIECKGKVVTPGLIDAITQIGLVEISMIAATNDGGLDLDDPVRAALDVSYAVNLRSTLVGVARRHGVTSAVSVPSAGLISGRSAWLDLLIGESESSPIVPRIAMHARYGADGASATGGSRAGAMMRLREVIADARLYRRDRRAFERNALRRLGASHLDLEALQDVLDRKIRLILSAHRAADILALVRFAEEEKIDIAIVGGNEAWLVAEPLARAQIPVILNPTDNLPESFEARMSRQDNAALLARAKVPLVISTMSSHNSSSLRFLLGNAVRAGLSWEDALEAATLGPARLYGRDKALGRLAAGQLAQVVVWSADPFEPSSMAETVIIHGRVQSTENRQTALRDKYKRRLGL